MLIDWPTEPFEFRLHRDPEQVVRADDWEPEGRPVVLALEGASAPELWEAERFRML
ncbi:hypothetical protein [Kitasatospora sp. NPDC093806]|uniref:hypothetical protein n=1 Tax=Kitasatospora sp. NPDC093806 TaxID=3155075 RepID=UPI00341644FD